MFWSKVCEVRSSASLTLPAASKRTSAAVALASTVQVSSIEFWVAVADRLLGGTSSVNSAKPDSALAFFAATDSTCAVLAVNPLNEYSVTLPIESSTATPSKRTA